MGVLLCMRVYTKKDVNEEFAACKRQSGQQLPSPIHKESFLSLQQEEREGNQHVCFPGRWSRLWIFIKWPFSHGSFNCLWFTKLCDLTCSPHVKRMWHNGTKPDKIFISQVWGAFWCSLKRLKCTAEHFFKHFSQAQQRPSSAERIIRQIITLTQPRSKY